MPDIFISAPEEKKETPPEPPRPETFLPEMKSTSSAFILKPKNTEFETKGPDEKLILILRQHPIINLKWIIVAIIMAITPILLKIFPVLSFLPGNFRLMAILGWYLVVSGFILENFISWFFNVFIITNERIVDIDFYSLIYKEVSDANIEKIQDVTYRMGGIFKSIFGYGDVFIQTAAEVSDFEFPAVPNPEKVARILQELAMQKKEAKD